MILLKFYHRMFWIALLSVLLASVTLHCTGKDRDTGRNEGGGTDIPDDPDTPDDVGEDVPPVEDTPTVLETQSNIELKHIIFKATESAEDFRYKSEFLLVVRSTQSSCIKIKTRPTDGPAVEAEEETSNDTSALKSCSIDDNATSPEENETNTEGEGEGKGEEKTEAANFRLIDKALALNDMEFAPKLKQGLFLASPALCSRRLFRMPFIEDIKVGDPDGLELVVTKTGRLAVQSSGGKVNIWVDEEYGNICGGGATPGSMKQIPFGPVNQYNNYGDSFEYKDQLRLEHIQNLAAAAEAAFDKLTGAYGAISDVDENGSIDIFISPDVNRRYFVRRESHFIDDFAVMPISKPEDLSNYNSSTNPTSNEGEVVYLWAPDPGGVYNYQIYPSANSLASNFAKGVVASQIMSLIIHNQHLIVNRTPQEEEFLTHSLMMMASQYIGGSEYSKWFLSQYLTSRPQGLSLDTGPVQEIVGEKYIFGEEESIGMRAMFGWYLHARLCSPDSIEPCDRFIEFINSPTVGKESLETILEEELKVTLEHFGQSVGLSLADSPESALDIWNANPPEGKLTPIKLPDFIEVSPSAPPETEELDNGAGALLDDKTDRTFATPFPSKKMLIFQPVLPDDDLEFQLAPNSVTYVLVTGLVEQETDVTAVLGAGLNVAILPLGERNSAVRRFHKEKLSQHGHLDLRPTNLTGSSDDTMTYTYYQDPEYNDIDYTVDSNREVWVFGSIDKNTINKEGEIAEISDADSINFQVNPCAGLLDSDLANCQARNHLVLVQVYIRSFASQLDPMLLVTSPNMSIFRGQSIWSTVTSLDSNFTLSDRELDIGVLCQSQSSWTGGMAAEDYTTCANGGLTQALRQTEICDKIPGSCEGDNLQQQALFSHYNTITNTGFEATYDNFLHSSLGYPYYNHELIFYHNYPECPRDKRCFLGEQSNRQFFNFNYNGDLDDEWFLFQFFVVDKNSVFPDPNSDIQFTIASDELIYDLETIKATIATPNAAEPFAEDSIFVSMCTELGFSNEACMNPVAKAPALELQVKAYIAAENLRIICYKLPSDNACGETLLQAAAAGMGGAATDAWFTEGENFFYILQPDSPIEYETYYRPAMPVGNSSFCRGNPGSGRSVSRSCAVSSEFLQDGDDIRRQLNVERRRYIYSGSTYTGELNTDFEVAADTYSRIYEVNGGKDLGAGERLYSTGRYWNIDDERNRQRYSPINYKAMEMIGKPERHHYVNFTVPGDQTTIFHTLLGGRDLSKGKYMLRVRIFPSD